MNPAKISSELLSKGAAKPGCPWTPGLAERLGVSGYGNIGKSQVVNCNDPWQLFPTWMDTTLIIRAGLLRFHPPGLRAGPALCSCLFVEKKQCCSLKLPPFTGLLFYSLLLLNTTFGICLIYFLPGF